VLVVFLFLRDWRATLVAATALPLSIIPTFWAMSLLGFTLNGVTLLSLSLVVGILVDDAIVEIENIMRHLGMGKRPYQAAMEAADEIGLAVIATTFTLVAVFLPTAFMSGVPGKFFVQFGWTAAIAVMFSLVVARMLTPMMSAYVLKAPKKAHVEGRWIGIYLSWTRWCLRHRIKTTLGALVFFFGSLAWCSCCRPDSSRPTTCRRRRCRSPCRRARTSSRPTRPRKRRAGSSARTATSSCLHDRRRRLDRRRSVPRRRQPRGAQGDADPEPDAARRARRRSQAGGRAAAARRPRRVPGARINVGFGGSNEKYTSSSPARTAPCSPSTRAASSRSCARCTASAT
jgi:hypothetical protein